MSALPICCSSCVCWLALTRELPAALTHTCCLARHCGSVLARAGPAFPQIRASPSRAEATMTANSLRICPLLLYGPATLCCSRCARLSAAGAYSGHSAYLDQIDGLRPVRCRLAEQGQ